MHRIVFIYLRLDHNVTSMVLSMGIKFVSVPTLVVVLKILNLLIGARNVRFDLLVLMFPERAHVSHELETCTSAVTYLYRVTLCFTYYAQ